MPGWDAAEKVWGNLDKFGPFPTAWLGEQRSFPEEPGLGQYQRRNIAVPVIRGIAILGAPRPPYFSWQGNPKNDGQPTLSIDDGGLLNGIRLSQTYAAARAFAGEGGVVFAYYLAAHHYVALDARWERHYSAMETEALEVQGPCSGLELLQQLTQRHGAGSGLTHHLRAMGYTAAAYGATSRLEGRWCVFDPRIFKRILPTATWMHEEILGREAFDPVPFGTTQGQIEDVQISTGGKDASSDSSGSPLR